MVSFSVCIGRDECVLKIKFYAHNTGILIVGLFVFPICALWINAKSLLLLLQQPPCIARYCFRLCSLPYKVVNYINQGREGYMAFIAPKHEGVCARSRVEGNKCHASRVRVIYRISWSIDRTWVLVAPLKNTLFPYIHWSISRTLNVAHLHVHAANYGWKWRKALLLLC
jgi:hypothetical protein